jgi:hypothetical protein
MKDGYGAADGHGAQGDPEDRVFGCDDTCHETLVGSFALLGNAHEGTKSTPRYLIERALGLS